MDNTSRKNRAIINVSSLSDVDGEDAPEVAAKEDGVDPVLKASGRPARTLYACEEKPEFRGLTVVQVVDMLCVL